MEETITKPNVSPFFRGYFNDLVELEKNFDWTIVNDVVATLLHARENDFTIYFVGNGGSATQASHMAQDLANTGNKAKTKGFRTLSLTDNTSYITMAANDYGYENIFTTQMAPIFKEGDVLIGISASGNSENVLRAAKLAKERGGKVIGLVGFDGGKLKALCDHAIHVPSQKGQYELVEDFNSLIHHSIGYYMINRLTAEKTVQDGQ